MIPLVDIHVHLLAGLDDGPRTLADAIAMCRQAYDDGTRMAAACAHQNEHWPAATAGRIRAQAEDLAAELRRAGISLATFPAAEIMATPDMGERWRRGELVSIADGRKYILVEMPDGCFVDLEPTVRALREAGLRAILAHPERHEEILHQEGILEDLVQAGCLVQVSARSLTQPATRADAKALRDWVRRGLVHLLGSDGHSLVRRPPLLAAAYEQVARWAGAPVADRIGSTNGVAVLQGSKLRAPEIKPRPTAWFLRPW